MAQEILKALKNKISDRFLRMLLLAMQAGIFISTGSLLYALVTSFQFDPNLRQLLGAMAFTTGLFLVIFLKAQLFTGNNLMFINLFKKENSLKLVIRNWLIVYLGNFVGAILVVSLLYFLFQSYEAFQVRLVAIAKLKTNYSFVSAYTRAILCNILVCLAVFLGVTGKTRLIKILGIFIPITIFVYFGFEHSIANMFFIPLGLSFSQIDFQQASQLFIGNIIPVTLGNITGGLILSIVILLGSKRFA